MRQKKLRIMTTTINISLNMPSTYGVERITRQLTEYAQLLIAQDAQESVIGEHIALTTEMLMAAQKAEVEFKAGQCADMQAFEKRFQKWL